MRFKTAGAGVLLLLLLVAAFPPQATGANESALDSGAPNFLRSVPMPDEYEELTYEYAVATNDRTGGALQIARVPAFTKIRGPADLGDTWELREIFPHPFEDYALITSESGGYYDDTGVWVHGSAGPLYKYVYGGALTNTHLTFDQAVSDIEYIISGGASDSAMTAYGTCIKSINLDTLRLAGPKTIIQDDVDPHDEVNEDCEIINALETGTDGFIFMAQDERRMSFHSSVLGGVYQVEDGKTFLARNDVVNSVTAFLEGYETSWWDTKILHPVKDSKTAISAYQNGITAHSYGVLHFTRTRYEPQANSIGRCPLLDMSTMDNGDILVVGQDYIGEISTEQPPDYDHHFSVDYASWLYNLGGYSDKYEMAVGDLYDNNGYFMYTNYNNEMDPSHFKVFHTIVKMDDTTYGFGNSVNFYGDVETGKISAVEPVYFTIDNTGEKWRSFFRPVPCCQIATKSVLTGAYRFNDEIVQFVADSDDWGDRVWYLNKFGNDNLTRVSGIPTSFVARSGSDTEAYVVINGILYLYSEDLYYPHGRTTLEGRLESPDTSNETVVPYTYDKNIAAVTVSWTDNSASVDGSKVSCNVSVSSTKTDEWFPVTNGVAKLILGTTAYNNTEKFNSADLKKFRYRFDMWGDTDTTPQIYGVTWSVECLNAPAFDLNVLSQMWTEEDEGDGTVVKYNLTWDPLANSNIRVGTDFLMNYGDENQEVLNLEAGKGRHTFNHLYLRPGWYTAACNGSFSWTSGTTTFTFYSIETEHFYIENRAPTAIIRKDDLTLAENIGIVMGQAAYLTGNLSSDPDGQISYYRWTGYDDAGNVLEGADASTVRVLYNIISPNQHLTKTVTLAVRDDGVEGASAKELWSEYSIEVNVGYSNIWPTIRGSLDAGCHQESQSIPYYQRQYNNTITVTSSCTDGDGIKTTWIRILDSGGYDVTSNMGFTSEITAAGNADYTFKPPLTRIGTYTIQLKARDNSGESDDDTTEYKTIATLKVTPHPYSGDWTVTEDMTLSGWDIELGGNLKIGANYRVKFSSCAITFDPPDDMIDVKGLTVYGGATFTVTNSIMQGGYIYKPMGSGTMGNMSSFERYNYWWCDVMGTLTASSTVFRHVGHYENPATGHECSGITFDKTGIYQGGQGSFTQCTIEHSLVHAVSSNSVHRISLSNTVIRDTMDTYWLQPSLTRFDDVLGRDVYSHIYGFPQSNFLISGCTLQVTGMVAGTGYGVYSDHGTVTMSGLNLLDNAQVGVYSDYATLRLEDSTVSGSYDGLVIYGGNSFIEDNTIIGLAKSNDEGVWLQETSWTGHTFNNNTIRSFDVGFRCVSSISCRLWGTRFQDCRARASGSIQHYTYHRVKVMYEGEPYEDVSVSLNTGNSSVYEGRTDETGLIPWALLLDRGYTGEVYSQANNSVDVVAFGYSNRMYLDTRDSGKTHTFYVKTFDDDTGGGGGGGVGWGKSGEGFFDLDTAYWITLAFLLLMGVGLAVYLNNIGYRTEGIYSLFASMFGAALLLFWMNGFWWPVAGCIAGLVVIAYLVVNKLGLIARVRRSWR